MSSFPCLHSFANSVAGIRIPIHASQHPDSPASCGISLRLVASPPTHSHSLRCPRAQLRARRWRANSAPASRFTRARDIPPSASGCPRGSRITPRAPRRPWPPAAASFGATASSPACARCRWSSARLRYATVKLPSGPPRPSAIPLSAPASFAPVVIHSSMSCRKSSSSDSSKPRSSVACQNFLMLSVQRNCSG